MTFENAETVGIAALIILASLSGYFLMLRIKEYFSEQPDPKLTYATLTEMEKLRIQLQQCQRDCRHDIRVLDEKRSRSIAAIHELIRKNAEHIAALIAQEQMMAQRITELNIKTERLQEKLKT